MARSITDARQVTLRQFLQQITNAATYAGTADSKPANQAELDNLLAALNAEVTPLLRMSASSTPNLVVTVGAAILANPESGYSRSIPHIGALLPNNFTSGTITFPAASGGTITVSPGNNAILTVASGNYIKVLVYMDATGALNVLPGVENAVEATASVLAAPKKTLPLGYVTLQNVGGVIQPIAQTKILQFGAGAGGASSGSGSGVGDDLIALSFKADVVDEFDDIPTGSDSIVDVTAGKTDATTYSAANGYYRLAYDATKTVTGTGTAMTMSGAPTFTVKIGDMLRIGLQARRITAVGSQTSYTIESAFTVNPAAAACTVSQAVYTKDLNAVTVDGLPINLAFSTNIAQTMVDYEDSTAADDTIFDANTTPVIAFTASSDNTNFTSVSVRPTLLTDVLPVIDLPTSSTNMYVRFFANNMSGSGFVNILKHKTWFHRDLTYSAGGIFQQAYAFTDGTGTEINCAAPSVVSGKTRLQTTWTYPVNINSGMPNGSLQVMLNGQKIPRFVDATVTPDASYREIDQRTIELDGDYSQFNYALEVIYRDGATDNIDTNSSAIAQLQESNQQGLQGFVNENARLAATASPGAPVAGTFYSQISGRAAIPDLTANLKVLMGVERIPIQQLQMVQNEFGPNGETVWSIANDDKNQIRIVGNADSVVSANGVHVRAGVSGDLGGYLEVVFYGTGLNLLGLMPGAAPSAVASVDGGAEGSNFLVNQSTIISARNYSANIGQPVVAGLAPGVHTVKIRNTNAVAAIHITGIEIVNETTTLKVQPGSSFANGKKLTLNSQQSPAYNSGFESGTLGIRGGRVLVYHKADGTIAKAVNPAGSQANLASTDHSNEEVVRMMHYREFGQGRADDFSTLGAAAGFRAYTLDDGTTTLVTSNAVAAGATGGEGVTLQTNTNNIRITFVGTGLDVVLNDGSALTNTNANSFTWAVDGTVVGNHETTGIVGSRSKKIVSGLPYGTHTVTFTRNAPDNFSPVLQRFVVYQPKKPALPTGAVELADYNVLATYVANTVASAETFATGVLRKQNAREFTYVEGTGGTVNWLADNSGTESSGFQFRTDRANAYYEYTFFGTGFEIRNERNTTRGTQQFSLQWLSTGGVLSALTTTNFPTIVTSAYSATFNAATGVASFNGAQVVGAGVSVSNLPLGLYKIRVLNITAGNQIDPDAIDIITPIHSHKGNIYASAQATGLVGSQGISDNRKTTAGKEALVIRNIARAIGITSGPTTSSVSNVPMPDMSVIVRTTTGRLDIALAVAARHQSAAGVADGLYSIYVNGNFLSEPIQWTSPGGNLCVTNSASDIYTVGPGVHKVDIYWRTTAGSINAESTRRLLTVKEV